MPIQKNSILKVPVIGIVIIRHFREETRVKGNWQSQHFYRFTMVASTVESARHQAVIKTRHQIMRSKFKCTTYSIVLVNSIFKATYIISMFLSSEVYFVSDS